MKNHDITRCFYIFRIYDKVMNKRNRYFARFGYLV
ncbi:hypothetical protein PSEEN2517 [Pseudomonas entomophila L48]|uniref:Uncharacterized protein n=1 Tax=Pseudomonas entomophila (strain L48) TaxID=384676 RepID=Q1IAJ8_PSEE4|nr:hypothetical protein PSEEN2517 [Pseudomonas entomophila L48]